MNGEQQKKDYRELLQARSDALRHHCALHGATGEYHAAVTECFEKEDGTLWVRNEEYYSQVNFCPECGYKAKKREEPSGAGAA